MMILTPKPKQVGDPASHHSHQMMYRLCNISAFELLSNDNNAGLMGLLTSALKQTNSHENEAQNRLT